MTTISATPSAILRLKAVEKRTGLSRSTIYEWVRAGKFPAPIRLGGKAVGWLENEIEGWIVKCVADSRQSSHQSAKVP